VIYKKRSKRLERIDEGGHALESNFPTPERDLGALYPVYDNVAVPLRHIVLGGLYSVTVVTTAVP